MQMSHKMHYVNYFQAVEEKSDHQKPSGDCLQGVLFTSHLLGMMLGTMGEGKNQGARFSSNPLILFGGVEGTRTLGLRRDRPAL